MFTDKIHDMIDEMVGRIRAVGGEVTVEMGPPATLDDIKYLREFGAEAGISDIVNWFRRAREGSVWWRVQDEQVDVLGNGLHHGFIRWSVDDVFWVDGDEYSWIDVEMEENADFSIVPMVALFMGAGGDLVVFYPEKECKIGLFRHDSSRDYGSVIAHSFQSFLEEWASFGFPDIQLDLFEAVFPDISTG